MEESKAAQSYLWWTFDGVFSPKHPYLHRLLCMKAARSSTKTAGLEFHILNIVFSLIMRTVTHPLIISLYIKRKKTTLHHGFNDSRGIHFVYVS